MSSSSNPAAASAQDGLFPQYKHVEEFGPDDGYEDEVEECYVTLDLGSADPTLVPSSSSYRLIGLDTPTPYLQLSGTIMKGRHRTLLGTELIFKEITEENEAHNRENIQYFASTERRILFREIELKPKEPSVQQATPQFHQYDPASVPENTTRKDIASNRAPSGTADASAADPPLQSPGVGVTQGENVATANVGTNRSSEPAVPTLPTPSLSESGAVDQAMDVDE
ncbi:hypothetical protein M0805_002594 [Coniferiporia weirii]|nr:hypothetical protein M0805_002594 [Coniferiporia weirii]